MSKAYFDLVSYLEIQKKWSTRVFGEGKRTLGLTEHITKELEEIKAQPDDIMEWVDVMILALDGAWRSGHSPVEVCKAMLDKQSINLQRKWNEVKSENESIHHVKEVGK